MIPPLSNKKEHGIGGVVVTRADGSLESTNTSESNREEVSHEAASKRKSKFRQFFRSLREDEKNRNGPWLASSHDQQDTTDDAGFVVARTRRKKKQKLKKSSQENEENEDINVKSQNSVQEETSDSEPKSNAGDVEQLTQYLQDKISDAKRTNSVSQVPNIKAEANQLSGGQIDSKIGESEECSKIQGPAENKKKKQAWLDIPQEDTTSRVFDCVECTICLAPLGENNIILLKCKHSFHSKCIHLWMERKKTCPYCGQHSLLPHEFPRLGEI